MAWLGCVASSGPELKRRGITMSTMEIPHPLSGPDRDALATDIAWVGKENASHVIGLISATHGIEGYAGSAIQHFLLELVAEGHFQLPENVAILFIHGLNPWGMAWHRRCDEQGIDVNRNFIDFSGPLPENPDYNLLSSVLSIASQQSRTRQLAQWREKLGETRYEIAVSGGQYSNPIHPFYGGDQPSFSNRVIEQVIKEFNLDDRSVLMLDLHTGLGAWGYGELICDHPPESAGEHYALSIFGDALTFPQRGTSSSVPKLGLLDYRWHQLMSKTGCYLTLEFGTYTTDKLLDTIIEDHQRWGHDTDPLSSHKQGKEAMLGHFAPRDIYWQQAVLFKAWQAVKQSIEKHK